MKRNNMGITLIALVIIIVVLLILAGVSIAMLTGDNGLITKANEAKIENAIGGVKEAMKLEQGEKKIEDINLTPEVLLSEGRVGRTVQLKDDGNYYMYYALKENAYSQMGELGKGNRASLKDVFLIDDEFNVRYIDKNGKEYGDEIEEKILTDETEVRFANKGFSEYVSKISGVKEEDMQFQWMKNQTSLTITDTSVTSLEDLVFFPNLEKLVIENLELENLEGIENCSKLKYYISQSIVEDNSKIALLTNLKTYIDYSPTTENGIKVLENLPIEELRLYGYSEKSTKVISNITTLKILLIWNSYIENLEEIGKLANLESLEMQYSKVNNLENIERLQKLNRIVMKSANISDITPLAYNKSLTSIDVRGNPNIDSNRENYTGQRLENLNKLSEILDKGGSIYLDVDKLKLFSNYKNLNLSSQNLNDLSCIEGMYEIEILNLNYNNISLQDDLSKNILSNMKNLKQINLLGNPIVSIKELNNLKKLETITIEKNENINLKDIEDILSNVKLNLYDWSSLENCEAEKIKKLSSSWSTFKEIPDLTKFKYLEEINLSNITLDNKASLNNISKCNSLKTLILNNADIHGYIFDFSNLTNLTNLDLSGNTLWDEDLENLKALKNNKNLTIYLSNNSLINPTALLELDSGTKIKLTGNVNLTEEAKTKLKERFGSNVTF